MNTARLLCKASQAIGAAAGTSVLAAILVSCAPIAWGQYAVSDAQLKTDVTTTLHNDALLKQAKIEVSASSGVVTLTGQVANEEERVEAEQAAAGVSGVSSIQDNLTLPPGAAAEQSPPQSQTQNQTQAQNQAPPPIDAEPGPSSPPQTAAASAGTNGTTAGADGMPPPPPPDSDDEQTGNAPGPQSSSGAGTARAQPPQFPQQSGRGYPDSTGENGGWGPRGNSHVPQAQAVPPPLPQAIPGVSPVQQNASGPVTLPTGTLLSVRTEQPLSTGALKGGESFQVTSAADVFAGGVVAIPRGAVLTGQVIEAKNAGPLAGRPQLNLRLTSVSLGGKTYPVSSEEWRSEGASKAGRTATNAAGGAIFGAVIGAIAGGGVGAGVGAIAGGATGTVVSGATHGPRLDLPPETLLTFNLAAPLRVQPVRYDEAARLAASVPTLRERPAYGPVYAPYSRPRYAPYPEPYFGYPPPY